MPSRLGSNMRVLVYFLMLAVLLQHSAMAEGEMTKNYKGEALTNLQRQVTQEEGTERAFANPYWDNHAAGLYVDIVSGEPLFSSADKFDSGTGWPSFTQPVKGGAVDEKSDTKLGMERVEVHAHKSGAHLGHVFPDGPPDRGGMRYCINSASLDFIPKDQLDARGYGAYKDAVEDNKKK